MSFKQKVVIMHKMAAIEARRKGQFSALFYHQAQIEKYSTGDQNA